MFPKGKFRTGYILVGLLVLVLVPACQKGKSSTDPVPASGFQLVQVDFAVRFDGLKPDIHLKSLEVSPGATVFDALETAANQCGFKVGSRGSGAMLFVYSINDIENEGALGKNWLFHINGELANRGAGAFEPAPGDRIEWSLGDYPGE